MRARVLLELLPRSGLTAAGVFVAGCRSGPLVPKTPSQALYVELLDGHGAPTWMSRDVNDLVDLVRNQHTGHHHHQQQQQQCMAGRGLAEPVDAEEAPHNGGEQRDRGLQQQQQQHSADGSDEQRPQDDTPR